MALSKTKRVLLWTTAVTMLGVTAIVVGVLALTGAFSKSINNGAPQQVNQDPSGYVLEHVTIVHRHGLRAPSQLSKWSNVEDYPMGLGFLTKKGKQGAAFVGRVFRTFYQDFLSYSPREVWSRSSTYKRCFETEYILLGTMYPPRGVWDFGFPVQPIPITMVPDGNDVNIQSCSAQPVRDFKQVPDFSITYMFNETHASLQHDNFSTVGDFIAWLAQESGYSAENSDFFEPIVDALYAQKYNGLPIPKWAEEKWSSMDWGMRRLVIGWKSCPTLMLSYEFWKWFIPYYGQYMGKTIAERTGGAANNTFRERLSILSYHDTTIQALMKALDLDTVKLYPSFLGALHFQLYKRNSDGEKFVRTVLHQGFAADGSYREAVELSLPNCAFPDCPVNKFVEIMKNLYPNTDRRFCHPVNMNALL
ncbi:putative acid phosphatase 5-like [Tropilaelaps mercedesae]|uniref:acid phosphatase n=1 Tax=Tropilaelaps mercedesae TaxID=418985 RepID=A0A1V9X5D5_9ACAR|nr:putative acid phosphatase 5-like [Tropilaelaps mercedesae]